MYSWYSSRAASLAKSPRSPLLIVPLHSSPLDTKPHPPTVLLQVSTIAGPTRNCAHTRPSLLRRTPPHNYVCSYGDWCSNKKRFIVYEQQRNYLEEVYECDMDEYQQTGIWLHPVPPRKHFLEPALVVNVEINIAIAPT